MHVKPNFPNRWVDVGKLCEEKMSKKSRPEPFHSHSSFPNNKLYFSFHVYSQQKLLLHKPIPYNCINNNFVKQWHILFETQLIPYADVISSTLTLTNIKDFVGKKKKVYGFCKFRYINPRSLVYYNTISHIFCAVFQNVSLSPSSNIKKTVTNIFY